MAKKHQKKQDTFYYIFGRPILGLAIVIANILVIGSVCCYCPTDNSFNKTGDGIKNIFGIFGANTADFILSVFGVALPMFLLAFFGWAKKLCSKQEITYKWFRFFVWFLGLLLTALCFDYANNLGGNAGKILSINLQKVLPSFSYSKEIITVLAGVFGFWALNFSACVPMVFWWNKLKSLSVFLYKTVCQILRYSWIFVRSLKKIPQLFGKKRQETTLRKEPKFKSDKDEPIEMKAPKIKVQTETKNKPVKKQENKNGYVYPSIDLLSKAKTKNANVMSEKELDETARKLEEVLQEFGVNGKIVKIRPGPVITLYELSPAPGTKTARVIGLADDIARSMSAVSVRIAVVTGKNTIGIELPNPVREIVLLHDLIAGDGFSNTKNALNVVLGKDMGGENVYADLAKMPHLLVAGTTGSGKSVGMNSMILSLLYKMSPAECRLIMIDPKMLEFSVYNGIPHLLTPVITDPAKAVLGLKWAVKEMEDRYRAMAQLNVRNISGYNTRLEELRNSGEKPVRTIQTGFDPETGAPIYEKQEIDLTPLPYIVVIVDEVADLMLVASKEVEAAIQRLSQMARAAGIHLILATQRPSVNVITGVIKANFPTRISFQVTSKVDSKVILGVQGAEQLLGMGDMLYMPTGQTPVRVHGSFVKDSEVEAIVEFLKSQSTPEYVDGITEGELDTKDSGSVFDRTSMGAGMGGDEGLYAQAVEIVRNDNKTSISYVQRRLRIGYNRAASLVERMEAEGVIYTDATGKKCVA
ncbi:MAG: DNA translocase FtsK 4TM domain-containing protein [Alphaproteobacteria bacterium]|nr:DNA translocase FtsK 4TM domain-containing protein [Alphaproteobacteria bacterium]